MEIISKTGTFYFLTLALASMYFGFTEFLSLKNVFGGLCLIIVAGFYFKGLAPLWKREMKGVAMISIGSVLLWLLAFNDLIGLGIESIGVRIPGLDGLTPPILLAPFSLILISITKRGEWR